MQCTTEPDGRISNSELINTLVTSASCHKQNTAETVLVIVHLCGKAHKYKKTLPVELDPGKPQLDTTFKTGINTAGRKLGLSITRGILAECW